MDLLSCGSAWIQNALCGIFGGCGKHHCNLYYFFNCVLQATQCCVQMHFLFKSSLCELLTFFMVGHFTYNAYKWQLHLLKCFLDYYNHHQDLCTKHAVLCTTLEKRQYASLRHFAYYLDKYTEQLKFKWREDLPFVAPPSKHKGKMNIFITAVY